LVIPETTLPSIPTNPAAASVELSRQKENYISMISEKNILKQLSAHAYSILPPSKWALLLLLAAASFATISSLSLTFSPGDDYAIYVHFAEAVTDGYNPYSLPDNFRSSVPPTILAVGSTQPSPGRVQQQYADYPPLLMLINSGLFQLHHIKGLYGFYIFLYALSCIIYCLYAFDRREHHRHDPFCYLIFFALNPLIVTYWFTPIEDKVWFVFFGFVTLLLREKRYWVSVALAIFASLKGVGLPMFAFYAIFLFVHRQAKPQHLLCMVILFASIVATTHVLWYPEWINAYEWRAARQSFVGHDSLFVPLSKANLYWGSLPKIMTASSFVVLGVLALKRKLTLQESLLLPMVLSIIFTTELGLDRLLVIVLCLLLLCRGNAMIVIAYVVGLFLTKPLALLPLLNTHTASWILIWGLTAMLVTTSAREVFNRKTIRLPNEAVEATR
jgi:hypothetical protein